MAKNELIALEDKLTYPRYTWVGNRISRSDMARLYNLKKRVKKPITLIVAEAVREFLRKEETKE